MSPIDLSCYTKEVEIEKLMPGDVLAHDIFLEQGLLLAPAGIRLTENHILRLKKTRKRVVTLDFSKVYEKATKASRVLMLKAARGQPIEKKEVMEIVDPFIKEANREKNAARLLIQLQSHDEYTFQHTVNIGVISMYIAKWLGYQDKNVLDITLAGILHDIGKSKIPLAILNKADKLNRVEFEIMKKHTIEGYKILSNYDSNIRLAVLQHHEREDGSGYPLGIKGNEIHPYAKIIAVADVYHAMTSNRVYKNRVSPLQALDEMVKSLDQLEPEIIFTFVQKMLDFYTGCKVLLNNGKIGTIIYIDKNNISKPLIKVGDEEIVVDYKKTNGLGIDKILNV